MDVSYLQYINYYVIVLALFFKFIDFSYCFADPGPAKPPPLRNSNFQVTTEGMSSKKVDAESKIIEEYISKDIQNNKEHVNYPVERIFPTTIIINGDFLDIKAIDISVVDLLNMIFDKSNKKSIVSSSLSQKVSLNIKNITLDELLKYLSMNLGFNWIYEENIYVISPIDNLLNPKFFPVNYTNLDELKKTLSALGLGGRIIVNNYPRGLFVNASVSEMNNVEKVIEKLDILSPSIRVEFVVVETNKNDEKKIGLIWDDFDASYSYSKLNHLNTNISQNLTAGVASILSESGSSGRILAKPYIITENNKEAHLSTGDEVPIFTKDYNGNPAVDYKKVGIELYTTPSVINAEKGILSIKAKTIVNIISGQQTQQGLTAPQISSRETENILNINSGEIVVIGGLLKEEKIKTDSGVPLLKDIPLIGSLFKTVTSRESVTDILIFIKPTLIKENQNPGSLESSMKY